MNAIYHSPIGMLQLSYTNTALTGLSFLEELDNLEGLETAPHTHQFFLQCKQQLDGYFGGTTQKFTLPLQTAGAPFSEEVWQALQTIPYGQTVCYEEMAKAILRPKAFRAVARANHVNPIAIIIPCHRVIGKNGSLTGYAGGLWRKDWLLQHEKKWVKRNLD